nr:ATP-dependent DNA helicase PIF1-like [Biomphalaria glabrata]
MEHYDKLNTDQKHAVNTVLDAAYTDSHPRHLLLLKWSSRNSQSSKTVARGVARGAIHELGIWEFQAFDLAKE